MTEWRDAQLSDLGTFHSGKPIKPGVHGPYRAYGSNGIIGSATEWRHERGIVVGRVGAYCGSVTVSREPFWASDNTIVIEPKAGNDLDFLYYLLLSADLHQHAGGAAQPLVTQSTLKNLTFRVPSQRVSRKLAEVLRSIDDLINNNRRRIEMLKEMARAIYREWFVDFRYPGHESHPLFDSRLGPIPATFTAGTVGDVLTLQRGFDLPSGARLEGNVPIVSSSGISGFHAEAKVAGPGVATGRSGTVGSVFYVASDYWPLNTTLWVKDFVRSSPLHAWFFLESLNLGQYAGGAAVPTLNRNVVHAEAVAVAPTELVSSFDRTVTPLIELAHGLDRQAATLSNLFDVLLPKLVTGQIDVSHLDLGALADTAVT